MDAVKIYEDAARKLDRSEITLGEFEQMIAPLRNVVKPKRGHWMIEPTEEPEYCKCSECGYVNLIVEVFSLDGYHYCPNCGAKMERNEDGTD